ncbi:MULTISPECIES: hypothetical protein [unclassified Agrococcus]|uniref:hypothetical protein n=1 Tax=unclassified Agrococcus TaxID=2615065 RepID=UPI0036090810
MTDETARIVRQWTALVETVRVDEYLAHMRATSYDAYVSMPGNLATGIMTRDLGDGRTEVRVLSSWRDEASIRGLVGDDVTVARGYPSDDEYLLEPPAPVVHWTVR